MKSKVDLFVINKVREKRKELGISQRGLYKYLFFHSNLIYKDYLYSFFFLGVLPSFFPPINFDI